MSCLHPDIIFSAKKKKGFLSENLICLVLLFDAAGILVMSIFITTTGLDTAAAHRWLSRMKNQWEPLLTGPLAAHCTPTNRHMSDLVLRFCQSGGRSPPPLEWTSTLELAGHLSGAAAALPPGQICPLAHNKRTTQMFLSPRLILHRSPVSTFGPSSWVKYCSFFKNINNVPPTVLC